MLISLVHIVAFHFTIVGRGCFTATRKIVALHARYKVAVSCAVVLMMAS